MAFLALSVCCAELENVSPGVSELDIHRSGQPGRIYVVSTKEPSTKFNAWAIQERQHQSGISTHLARDWRVPHRHNVAGATTKLEKETG